MKTPLLWLFALLALSVAATAEEDKPIAVGEPLEPVLGAYWPYSAKGESGFVNLRIVDHQFQLFFLEEDRATLAEPAFAHAVVHYSNTQRRSLNNQTLTLNAGSGPFLGSPRNIQAPHRYQVRLFLTDQLGQSTDAAGSAVLGQKILNQLTEAGAISGSSTPGTEGN